MSSDPAVRLEELQNKLKARQVALQERIDSVISESGDQELPTLEALNEERMQLIKEIRHSKDEGDAIMRELEMNEELFKVYSTAARVQRFERFTEEAERYVRKDLPKEIEDVADADKRHSEEEVASYITELQAKRDQELKRIATLKERTSSRSIAMRNGPRVEAGTPNARRRSAAKKEELEKEEQDIVGFTEEQRCDNAEMHSKVKQLRQECSKLQLSIIDEKHRNSKRVAELNTRIRQADLQNKSDTRRCAELNTGNATLTTNSQILMGQLNGEHYGLKGAPSLKAVIKMRKEDEKKAAKRKEREQNGEAHNDADEDVNKQQQRNGSNSRGAYNRTDSRMTDNSNAASGVSSRRQSLSKPPLVALKPTESQRNREAAVKAEMDQRREDEDSVQRSHRRGSLQGSEGSLPEQKPPRVASVQTQSSRNRMASRENSVSSKKEY